MKTRTTTAAAATLLLLCAFGCSVGPPPQPVERQSQALLYWRPFISIWAIELVGHGLNGISLNDQPLEDHLVVAVSLDDAVLESGQVKDLHLKRTRFYTEQQQKKKTKLKLLKDQKLPGTRFTAYLEDGTEITLRIGDAAVVEELPEAYHVYEVSYLDDEEWIPLCGLDPDTETPLRAVALNGTWEYEQGIEGGGDWIPNDRLFTFACEDYVLAKCVALGYTPWSDGEICDTESPDDDCIATTLASRHQACTRALRADYCGDGTSFTVNGVQLNLYDGIGIRADAEDWSIEAEWDSDGARCAVAERVPHLPTPPCLDALFLADCGNPVHLEEETLLITEIHFPSSD